MATPTALTVHADFPGGAVKIENIDQRQRRIVFQPPETETGGLRSWWCFQVRGCQPGETLTLELTFGKSRAQRAVYSADGKNWHFTARARREGDDSPSIYTHRVDGAVAWFAWYQPYLPEQAEALIARAEKRSPHAKRFVLCPSEENRPVVGLRVSEPGTAEADRVGVWIQARQHAWETGASWAAEGFVEWLVSDDPRAQALRRRANVTVIPIMDVDSVAKGLGGKWQKPHDHNRDWNDMPHWRAVRTAILELKKLDQAGRLDMILDLHDMGWEGTFEFWCNPYPVMGPVRKANTDLFLKAATAEIVGPLKFDPEVYSPYPITTPTCGNWSSQRTRETVVGGTCEIGVHPPEDFPGRPPELQLLAGRQLGLAIERYFREPGRKAGR